jgi:preprotein translocase subunit SecG
MGFLIGLLVVIMLLDCLALILLVLIQLPKKEAGAGLAFGAGATDALFGAGSGTVLTKITRWAATIFFCMCVLLAIMMSHYYRPTSSRFERDLSKAPSDSTPAVSAPVAPTPATATTPTSSNANFLLMNTNTPALGAPAVSTNLPEAVTPPPAPTAPK